MAMSIPAALPPQLADVAVLKGQSKPLQRRQRSAHCHRRLEQGSPPPRRRDGRNRGRLRSKVARFSPCTLSGMRLTPAQGAGLLSAILGALGTITLFFSSYAFQPLIGGVFGSPAITEDNNRIKEQNLRRSSWQKVGLAVLCLSFVVQAVACLL
jgi:hypothetical protein